MNAGAWVQRFLGDRSPEGVRRERGVRRWDGNEPTNESAKHFLYLGKLIGETVNRGQSSRGYFFGEVETGRKIRCPVSHRVNGIFYDLAARGKNNPSKQ